MYRRSRLAHARQPQGGAAAANPGSSSWDSEGYPSTLCPAISFHPHTVPFYDDITPEDFGEDDQDRLRCAVEEELEEIDDDLDELEEYLKDSLIAHTHDVGDGDWPAFISEYNRVAPMCGWSCDAQRRKRELFAESPAKELEEMVDDMFSCACDFAPPEARDQVIEHCQSGGALHSSAVYAIIDPAEDEQLFHEAQSEADSDYAAAIERLEDSTDVFRRIVRKYGTVSLYTMTRRCGRVYTPVKQPAPSHPAFWNPALSHRARNQIIRSSGIMHTLLRGLSLFNVTPNYAVLNDRFVSWIGRRCCSTLMITQLSELLEHDIEGRLASGSQYVFDPSAALPSFSRSFVFSGAS
jgi:hypothetical protein